MGAQHCSFTEREGARTESVPAIGEAAGRAVTGAGGELLQRFPAHRAVVWREDDAPNLS